MANANPITRENSILTIETISNLLTSANQNWRPRCGGSLYSITLLGKCYKNHDLSPNITVNQEGKVKIDIAFSDDEWFNDFMNRYSDKLKKYVVNAFDKKVYFERNDKALNRGEGKNTGYNYFNICIDYSTYNIKNVFSNRLESIKTACDLFNKVMMVKDFIETM